MPHNGTDAKRKAIELGRLSMDSDVEMAFEQFQGSCRYYVGAPFLLIDPHERSSMRWRDDVHIP